MADIEKRWTMDVTVSQRMLTEAEDPLSSAAYRLRAAMFAALGEPAQAARAAGCGVAMIGPELVEDSPAGSYKARALWVLLPGTPAMSLRQFANRAEFDQWVLDGMSL